MMVLNGTKHPTKLNWEIFGVEIDLVSREETEEALKYLKNNKEAGSDSITAELLKQML